MQVCNGMEKAENWVVCSGALILYVLVILTTAKKGDCINLSKDRR